MLGLVPRPNLPVQNDLTRSYGNHGERALLLLSSVSLCLRVRLTKLEGYAELIRNISEVTEPKSDSSGTLFIWS